MVTMAINHTLLFVFQVTNKDTIFQVTLFTMYVRVVARQIFALVYIPSMLSQPIDLLTCKYFGEYVTGRA